MMYSGWKLNRSLPPSLFFSCILWPGLHCLLLGREAAVFHGAGPRAQLASVCHGTASLQRHDDRPVPHLWLQTPLARSVRAPCPNGTADCRLDILSKHPVFSWLWAMPELKLRGLHTNYFGNLHLPLLNSATEHNVTQITIILYYQHRNPQHCAVVMNHSIIQLNVVWQCDSGSRWETRLPKSLILKPLHGNFTWPISFFQVEEGDEYVWLPLMTLRLYIHSLGAMVKLQPSVPHSPPVFQREREREWMKKREREDVTAEN